MALANALQLPPGFRFHPTDEELVVHYLCRKSASQPIAVPVIAEVDLYRYDPWDLPEMAIMKREKEWYFFTPRDRKYPNGLRPSRSAGSGYWKATGADKGIGRPKPVGIKKALVFYTGKAPKGEKTNWIMHEYRLADVDRSVQKKNSSRLDDWVLCRIYNKKGYVEKPIPQPQQNPNNPHQVPEQEEKKPEIPVVVAGPSSRPPMPVMRSAPMMADYMIFGPSDSVPKLHSESSCSEHVWSPEFACEVQSELKWKELEKALDFPYNYIDPTLDSGIQNQFQSPDQMPSLQNDMFMYMPPRPF